MKQPPGKAPGRPPKLDTLYFYLTEGCNLRCRHCWIEPSHQSEKRQYPALDLALFRHILQQARPLGLSSVKLTGGEPLMHPHIGEILGILRQKKLRFNMETNGVLCTPELAQELIRSGIYHISVSLDGADADTHEWVRGVKGCFDAAVSGVCGIYGILGVLAGGSYALCGIGETVPELVFGRASVDSLSEIGNCSPVLNDIREGLPRRLGGICGDCIMKNFCPGSCIARNYYRDRDFWAPHWYCHEAHRQGLFPRGRASSGQRLVRAGEARLRNSRRSGR